MSQSKYVCPRCGRTFDEPKESCPHCSGEENRPKAREKGCGCGCGCH
ncbi:50S ribosomal protein L40e [Fonticella tunisiensis]|nr:50S ribosomal protein L40e [Fonticella tunisiensis]